ncbi:hypothetical protein GCM10010174_12720 [Kutzneria viridogrisea]|uniref:Secreted protein n=2 Tax=Kutzneria TaxID=43356 RepID=W5WIX3_9PSEU|nr:hypothetical protein [Kutzneria albida]AHI01124.1 hypothetical protein KALB_7766 [Kutzneria albida DSM 43870]MBA8926379.1 hypothetical protein [Kutzneria viridogrisea]
MRPRVWLVLFAAAVLAAGCGVRPTPVITGKDAPRGVIAGTHLFFVSEGKLRDVQRPLTSTSFDTTSTLRTLLAGPTDAERKDGLSSELPTEAKLTTGNPAPDYAFTVQVFSEVPLSELALDQITCTALVAQNAYGGQTPQTSVRIYQFRGEGPTTRRCPVPTA